MIISNYGYVLPKDKLIFDKNAPYLAKLLAKFDQNK